MITTSTTPQGTPMPVFSDGSDISDCGQWEVGPGDQPVRVGVTLSKDTDNARPAPTPKLTPVPWYPLQGHRQGLRANDLGHLASAFVVISYHGGTAH